MKTNSSQEITTGEGKTTKYEKVYTGMKKQNL